MSRSTLTPSLILAAALVSLLGLLAGRGGVRPPLPQAPAAGGGPSFADVVERLNPAVVAISVVENGPPDPEEEAEAEPGPRRGEGTGFLVDPSGLVLTNHHVVAASERIRVRFSDKRELPARLVGSDPSTDLALIKVAGQGFPVMTLGDSDRLRVGDWVCAIGNPFTYEHSVTVGVVSSKGRKIYDLSFDAYIQTDAAINPGNSGGPLINVAGEVVGISAAMSTEGQGIGFAVPINLAREILDQLRTRGHVSRGYLGVQLQELDPDLRRLVGYQGQGGAMVVDLLPGSAGQAAGLRPYDIIAAVSGRPVVDGDQLIRLIAAHPPGATVQLGVFREGASLAVQAVLAERRIEEGPAIPVVVQGAKLEGDALGLKVVALSRRTQAALKIPKQRLGVVVEKVTGLSRGLDEIQNGDLVLEVNRQPTPDLTRYRATLKELTSGEVAVLLVFRPQPPGMFLAKVEVEDARAKEGSGH
ncbi:MAG TPA: trypsin-like peptidase domain-containing protein [Vicinamibacteria bacterium]|nr:trypsin-like peptidase domain-containing protein [Vicinamibacteria bacterium]